MTSSFTSSAPQADGRAFVTEIHTDDLGEVHRITYLSEPTDDRQAIMTARAAVILAHLKAREIEQATDGGRTLTPRYNTGAEFVAAWRERFRDASREEAARMAKWLLDAIDAGRFTVAQIRNAFGITLNQWNNTLQPRLAALRSALIAIDTAQGE